MGGPKDVEESTKILTVEAYLVNRFAQMSGVLSVHFMPIKACTFVMVVACNGDDFGFVSSTS
jgi:hypothetical protein